MDDLPYLDLFIYLFHTCFTDPVYFKTSKLFTIRVKKIFVFAPLKTLRSFSVKTWVIYGNKMSNFKEKSVNK